MGGGASAPKFFYPNWAHAFLLGQSPSYYKCGQPKAFTTLSRLLDHQKMSETISENSNVHIFATIVILYQPNIIEQVFILPYYSVMMKLNETFGKQNTYPCAFIQNYFL